MLSSFIEPIRAVAKVGSVATKFFALGMTGFGLKKLWSDESQQKHSLPVRAAFSGAYVLHMGSTTLATAAWFGSESISPPVATALVGATSLLTSYANLMEAYFSHSILRAKHTALENRLTASNLDLQRSLALVQSVSECESEIQTLNDQLSDLNGFISRLRSNNELKKLKAIYLELSQRYQERANRNDILTTYFKKIKSDELNIELVLCEIREKINILHSEIEQKRSKLNQKITSKTQARLENQISKLEQDLKACGIINIQCIRYIKIEEHVKLLQKLLKELAQDHTNENDPSRAIERNYLEDRINAVRSSLDNCIHPTDTQTLDLDLGQTLTVDQYIEEDPDGFKEFLETSLINHIESLQAQANELRASSDKIQQCFRIFIKQPIDDIQNHRLQIRNINQEIVSLKCDLSLEKLNEEARKTKLNLSSIASVLALSMCLLPQGELSSILNPLMLSIGIMGGMSSLWQFYNKNLLAKKIETQKQNKTQCLNKELNFQTTNDLERTSSADLERMLKEAKVEIKAVPQPIRKVLPPRHARENAKVLIFSSSAQRRSTKKKEVNYGAGKAKQPAPNKQRTLRQ